MFDIGLSEIMVIMIIALLVIGPKRLPDVARAIGKGMAEFKRTLNNVKDELNVEQFKSEANEMKDSLLFGKDEVSQKSPDSDKSHSEEEPSKEKKPGENENH